jgi:DNA polymerase-3 subunit delta'
MKHYDLIDGGFASVSTTVAGTRIILTAADPTRLLPTVRSRCTTVRVPLPSAAESLPWLEAQGVPEPAVLLAAAGGRPLDALALQRAGIGAAAWKALPAALARGQAALHFFCVVLIVDQQDLALAVYALAHERPACGD